MHMCTNRYEEKGVSILAVLWEWTVPLVEAATIVIFTDYT